jgi:hypothetical protein
MDKGRVVAESLIDAMKQAHGQLFELRVKAPDGREGFLATLAAAGFEYQATDEDILRVFVPGSGGAHALFSLAASHHVQVRHLRPSVATLEDAFARAVGAE